VSADDVIVPGWPPPRGYSNGRIGTGRVLHIGGQIGWDTEGTFPQRETADAKYLAQFAQTLDNVLAVVTAAGGQVTDLAAMTVFVVDMPLYRRSRTELAAIWKERLGKHYPAMALVAVTELFEPEALVEIEAVAYIGAPS
jgi:enamine deaminase RidA (YjgF/YER057c/UK114 family)